MHRYVACLPMLTMALATALLCSCTSPGEPTRYIDLNIYPLLTATPVLSPTAGTETFTFGIFNADLLPHSGVNWQMVRTNSAGLNPVTIQTGSVDLNPQSWQSLTVVDSSTPAAGGYLGNGVFIYTLTIDTTNTLSELNESNNTATATVTFADLNLSFSVAPTVQVVSGQPVITATVLNSDITTTTPPVGATAKQITIQVSDEVGHVFSTTTPNGAVFSPVAAQDLATGATMPITITLPASEAGAGHVFTVTIDPANQIPESSKSDNSTLASPIGTI